MKCIWCQGPHLGITCTSRPKEQDIRYYKAVRGIQLQALSREELTDRIVALEKQVEDLEHELKTAEWESTFADKKEI